MPSHSFDRLVQRLGGPYDVIVAFGYGPVLPGRRPGTGRLNRFARINALAAGMLYRAGLARGILPTGGRTGGPHLPSEAFLMAEWMKVRFGVPEEAFLLEEEAVDTVYNVVYAANLLDRRFDRPPRLLFVGMGFHLPRIRAICRRVGLEGAFVAAEEVVKHRSPRHARYLAWLLNPARPDVIALYQHEAFWLRRFLEVEAYWTTPPP